jgi:hypothetical protein
MLAFSIKEINQMDHRKWAEPSHEQVGSSEEATGHDPSPEAIGGYYGMQWYEIFKDNRGELYAVRCYEGTNRSKEAHKPEPREEEPALVRVSSGFTFGEIAHGPRRK